MLCMPPRDRARSHCGFRTWTSGLQRTVVDIRHDLFNCESVPSLGSRCMLCESQWREPNGSSIRGSAPLPFNAQRGCTSAERERTRYSYSLPGATQLSPASEVSLSQPNRGIQPSGVSR